MKRYIYSLFSTMALLSSLVLLQSCLFEEEETCTSLPSSITVKVYFNLWDNSDGNEACLDKWIVEFFKHHCNAGNGSKMSYEYDNCFEDDDGHVNFQRTGIGTWDVTFNYEEDYLGFYAYGTAPANNTIPETNFSLSGKNIYDRTNQGSKSLIINLYYDNNGEWTWK